MSYSKSKIPAFLFELWSLPSKPPNVSIPNISKVIFLGLGRQQLPTEAGPPTSPWLLRQPFPRPGDGQQLFTEEVGQGVGVGVGNSGRPEGEAGQ